MIVCVIEKFHVGGCGLGCSSHRCAHGSELWGLGFACAPPSGGRRNAHLDVWMYINTQCSCIPAGQKCRGCVQLPCGCRRHLVFVLKGVSGIAARLQVPPGRPSGLARCGWPGCYEYVCFIGIAFRPPGPSFGARGICALGHIGPRHLGYRGIGLLG